MHINYEDKVNRVTSKRVCRTKTYNTLFFLYSVRSLPSHRDTQSKTIDTHTAHCQRTTTRVVGEHR